MSNKQQVWTNHFSSFLVNCFIEIKHELKARSYTGALESVLNLYPFLDPDIKRTILPLVTKAKTVIKQAGSIGGVNRSAIRKSQLAFLDRHGAPVLDKLLDTMMDSIHGAGYFSFEKLGQTDINKEDMEDAEVQ